MKKEQTTLKEKKTSGSKGKKKNKRHSHKKRPMKKKSSLQSQKMKQVAGKVPSHPFFQKFSQLRRRLQDYREWFLFFLVIGMGIWCFTTFTIHQVSGESMAPTLANKERIVIRKTDSPNRYDIITFVPEENPEENYVKRVIGIPGDAFYVQGKRLYLFSARAEYADTAELSYSDNLPDSTQSFYLTDETSNQLLDMTKIPKDSYFVVGDNRRHSTDSRAFSFVKKSQIEGVLSFRVYPFNKFGVVH
ncbi:signal peptidase I [uncultured Enterococcus sp.]|uniref:signal peptidase I n=1 Tax=uncultured Enterococcus sp. TaxID=167972 RepID=UPI002AA87613|nr:signal peptidase I [uncultured Enterococcus sp.]